MPGTLEAYYQEAGRAGRDGKPAACYLLHAFPDRFTHEFFIKGAYPERALVEEVYDVLRRNADAIGRRRPVARRHRDAAQDQGRRSRRRVGAARPHAGRRVRASHRRAARASSSGCSPRRSASSASSARANDSLELGILRAMWRVAGEALNDGAAIDLDGLPPGFGRGTRRDAAARRAPVAPVPRVETRGRGQRSDGAEEAAHRLSHRLGRRSIVVAAPISQKLDAMQQYAYTKGCRRGFVLRYFGDPAARTSCGGCDNCLGTRVDVEQGGAAARAAASGVARREDAAAPCAGATAQRAADEAPVLTGADEALLARLRDLRRTISQSRAGAGVRRVSRSHARRNGRAPPDERDARWARFEVLVR